ncbi:MAG TPA: hypothetical protein VHE78_04155 [Gemmatimonadaceae bacterium]|nr:hypothetical protein [Gemmatimonadaceae bacterium]
MRVARICEVALLFGVTAVVTSCGDLSPLSPHLAARQAAAPALAPLADKGEHGLQIPKANHDDEDGQLTDLLSCDALDADTATMTIGAEGGRMSVGPHRFEVPAGALSSDVTITAILVTDGALVNHVRFEPHGLRFQIPATLTMQYDNCSDSDLLRPPKAIAYVDPDLHIISRVPSVDHADSKTVVGRLRHFSDYAVAW